MVVGVPIDRFCSTYAKDLATKSVGISLVIKIKDNPSQKASLMRQYATFKALGKQHCKGAYAPEVYGFTTAATPAPITKPNTSIDISQNTPIFTSVPTHYSVPEDYFTGYDQDDLAALNSQQLEIVQARIAKAKTEFAEIVDELISDGRLKAEDRDEMVRKITFKFSNNCTQLDGKILVRQRYNQYNNPIKTELINLFITINLCFTHSYDQNYETFLDRIIYHELGHYYNYFYDPNDSAFVNICRNGTQNSCPSSEFVSSYAASSSDEDYAETFAYYVYDKKPASTPVQQQKIDYFKIRDPRN